MSSRRRLTRIGQALAVAEANTGWLAMLATHPELGNLLQRWSTGDTTLTEREVGTVYTLQLHFWRTVENARYQYLQRSLPEEVESVKVR